MRQVSKGDKVMVISARHLNPQGPTGLPLARYAVLAARTPPPHDPAVEVT